jgi:gliding motility-associated-like protein
MIKECKILITFSTLILLSAYESYAQPSWVTGTPSVDSTGPLSVTMNYGINMTGTVYIIVYNFNNTSILSSSTVRTRAMGSAGGTLVKTAVISVRRADIGKVLQVILDVKDPSTIHTIYIVAADSKGKLQANPVRLNATTLPCPRANAGSDGEECDLNFVLNAVQVLPGTWSKVSGPGNASFAPNAGTPDATVTVSAYGTYVFRWTQTQGVCNSSDDVSVIFHRPPVSNAGSGGSTCGAEFNLRAVMGSAGQTGLWIMKNGSGTASFYPSASEPSVTVSVSDYGTKVFTWILTDGICTDSSDVTVSFNRPPVSDAGEDENNCGREYFMKAIPSIGTGTWIRVSGPGSASFSPNNHDPQARVTVSAFGTYVFRWTEVSGSCSSSSTVTIGFFEQIAANGGNGGDECDLTFNLNAVPGTGTGTWSLVSGPGTASFSPDPHRYNAIVTVTMTGSYDFEWREVSSNCTSSDIIRVNFHPRPYVSAGTDASLCKGNTIRLQAQGNGSFSWTPTTSLSNPRIADPVASPASTTTYTVTLTDQWNCSNSDNMIVTVMDKPVVDAGPDITLENIFETNLSASPLLSFESGEWIVLQGTGTFENKNSNITEIRDMSAGDNILIWSVSNGVCPAAVDTIMISIRDILIPSVITPNSDGINDYFIIKAIESFGITKLIVFNRWGASVYKSEKYINDWDGRDFNGKLLPDDTYFYIIKPEKVPPIKGYIVIKR